VDEETLDVVADPVFVADPDLDGDSGNSGETLDLVVLLLRIR
jgi:hypothetical protein